ncbi:MAG: deoxyhypusine synthase family protein [Candidatus Methylomirabilis sp.]|nr:deoxyhypusine synthase family protein [Deltaproteobacteria bacterium]
MKFKPISSKGLKTYSIKDRKSKVSVGDFAVPSTRGSSFAGFLESLPNILAARDIKEVASAVVQAHRSGRTVAVGMGAHVIKTGLSPLIIDLMERGVVSAIAMNGACVVHDFETAFAGCTSEDVDAELGSGSFGMAEETGRLLNKAIKRGAKKGLGCAVGEMIWKSRFPHKDKSILAAGARLGIPVTVHVALGTDILHIHPHMDGAATGAASTMDFRIFSSVVASLEGGIYVNIGSAVILPEVFLKAITLVRNLGHDIKGFSTVNMDFIQHYRPLTNVVRRPTMGGGKGYRLTGHHEIMVPLLYGAVIEMLGEGNN